MSEAHLKEGSEELLSTPSYIGGGLYFKLDQKLNIFSNNSKHYSIAKMITGSFIVFLEVIQETEILNFPTIRVVITKHRKFGGHSSF